MMYEEFTKGVGAEIGRDVYERVVEPVYTELPGMTKEEAFQLYKERGLDAFKMLLPTAKALESVRRRDERIKALEAELEREREWKPCTGGTNLPEEKYLGGVESSAVRVMSEAEAKKYLLREFGFAPEAVEIIREVNTYEADRHGRMRKAKTFKRAPWYCSTDWNYIRFNAARWQWECINGALVSYET